MNLRYHGAERRSAPRIPYTGQAVIRAKERRLACTAVNISATGILVLPPARASSGLPLWIDFELPDHRSLIRVRGVLARETRAEGAYAWGIHFLDVPAPVTTAITRYVVSRSQAAISDETERPKASAPAAPAAKASTDPQAAHAAARASVAPRRDDTIPRRSSSSHPRARPGRPPPARELQAAQRRLARDLARAAVRSTQRLRAVSDHPAGRSNSNSVEGAPSLAGLTAPTGRGPAQSQKGDREGPAPHATDRYGSARAQQRKTRSSEAGQRSRQPTPERKQKPAQEKRQTSRRAAAKRAADAARTKEWSRDTHRTPLEIRELYQQALDDVEGKEKRKSWFK